MIAWTGFVKLRSLTLAMAFFQLLLQTTESTTYSYLPTHPASVMPQGMEGLDLNPWCQAARQSV